MAQTVDLYIDTATGKAVRSDQDPTIVPLPRFFQGDTFGLNVYLLKQNVKTGFPNAPAGESPYSIILNSAMTMKAALGVKDGLAGSDLYTWQYTWVAAGTEKESYFTGSFPMNTAGIRTLLGSKASARAWFEIEITVDGLPWTVLQEEVSVQAEVIDTDTVGDVPSDETPISLETARQLFLGRIIKGTYFLEDINNPGQYIALFNQNGTLQVQNVGGNLPI
ncbi:MAG TPA: hypothetical protein VHL11_11405 [Phototrophicaceae bacterium]|nr:hypothetical protein [Phototrophicaceae bacterium]